MPYSKKDIEKWIRNPAKPTIRVHPQWKREHWIAHLATTNHWKEGAELGVWKGRTFLHLLRACPKLTMHGVDLWAPQPDNDGPEQYTEPQWQHDQFEKMVRTGAEPYQTRAHIYKMSTHEASKLFSDESLDFIFIDADHSSEAVRQDINDWVPKVKSTGWIIGHDINWPPVKAVVDELVPGYVIGPDNAWGRPKSLRVNNKNLRRPRGV